MFSNLIKYAIIGCFLISCSANSEQKVVSNPVEKQKRVSVQLPEKYYGYWVNEKYLQDLEKTNSTKQAQILGNDDVILIYDKQNIMQLNLHEGGGKNVLLMISANKG